MRSLGQYLVDRKNLEAKFHRELAQFIRCYKIPEEAAAALKKALSLEARPPEIITRERMLLAAPTDAAGQRYNPSKGYAAASIDALRYLGAWRRMSRAARMKWNMRKKRGSKPLGHKGRPQFPYPKLVTLYAEAINQAIQASPVAKGRQTTRGDTLSVLMAASVSSSRVKKANRYHKLLHAALNFALPATGAPRCNVNIFPEFVAHRNTR